MEPQPVPEIGQHDAIDAQVDEGNQRTKNDERLLGWIRVELLVWCAQQVDGIRQIAGTTQEGDVKSSPTPS